MDYIAKLNELNAKKAELINRAEELINDNKFDEAEAINADIKTVSDNINSVTALMAESQKEAKPVDNGKKTERIFDTLGEQMAAIANSAKTGKTDERLLKVADTANGMNEAVDADGGYLIQEDFAGNILESAAKESGILSRVDKYTVSKNADSMRWVSVDENSIASTVYGGVQMYWVGEAGTITPSTPKLKESRIELEKLAGAAYVTGEMLQDAAFLSSFLGKAFRTSSIRVLEDAIINGNGVGKPTGILEGSSLVTVAKESGQTADTFVAENMVNMWSRLGVQYRNNAVWLMNPDVEAQLPALSINGDNVYIPEGGLSGKPYSMLYGRPIIFTDNCAALGDKGDVILADLSQYMLISKGNAKQDWSMHVAFLTDQNCFRITYRVNGMPKQNTALTIKNSSNTRSAFVVLAARA